jgi:hypothetical protein
MRLHMNRAERQKLTDLILQGLNTFVVMELTIGTLFAQVFIVRHQMTCC